MNMPIHVLHGIDPVARHVVALAQRRAAATLRELVGGIELCVETDAAGTWRKVTIDLEALPGVGSRQELTRIAGAFRSVGLNPSRMTVLDPDTDIDGRPVSP